MNRLLLCTDLDRTLLPNGPQPESLSARKTFRKLAERNEVVLVFVSGRDEGLVKQAIKNYQLPMPDYVVADVGSSIYKIDNHSWNFVQDWDDEISLDWNNKTNKELQQILTSIPDIRLQEYTRQKSHKLSYYVPLYINHENLLNRVEHKLETEHVSANLVWSIDAAANVGLLDILPASANKKHAIEYLMQEMDFNYENTVFAGDSGNDISVMVSPIHSILVANALPSVKEHAQKRAIETNEVDTLYISKGDYYGMNGNYSAGIIEGVAHYMPEIEKWLGLENEYEQ